MLTKSSHKALGVALAATIAMMASNARGGEPTTSRFTISVDTGNGWQPYEPPAPPKRGKSGMNVNGMPYDPPAPPPVTHANPAPPRGKSGMNVNGMPYDPPAPPPITHANPGPPRGKSGMNVNGMPYDPPAPPPVSHSNRRGADMGGLGLGVAAGLFGLANVLLQ